MDTRTGKIYMGNSDGVVTDQFGEPIDFSKLQEDLIEIDINDATEKQRKTLQVSPYDNKSTLGKSFTQLRKERREANELNMGIPRERTPAEKNLARAKRKAAKHARKKNRK